MFRSLSAALLVAVASLAGAAEKITVYQYSEYIDPEIPKAFTAKTGIEVDLQYYESMDDMLNRLRQPGGAAQYDVVVATDVAIPQILALKLVQKVDPALVPNAANLVPHLAKPFYDPRQEYSFPYQWGTVGLIYRTSVVTAAPADISWNLILGETPAGRFLFMDEMKSCLGAVLRCQGKSVNTTVPTELKAAGELLAKAKGSPKCLGFTGGVDGRDQVIKGDADIALVYNGDAMKVLPTDGSVAFAIPKEGSVLWVDCMLVSAQARNPKGAAQWINFILDPQVGAQLSNYNRYASPNAAAMPFITEGDRTNAQIYPGEAMLKLMEPQRDLGKDERLYKEIWTSVKTK
jgi:spermidine/putrescine transport system substrate-binding protein